MLYFHGNGCDLGEMALDLRDYAAEFQMHVIGVEWTGYGYNLGSPSEGALNQDALDAWTFVANEWKIPSDQIVIFGRSIGTGPAVWLSHRLTLEKTPPAKLILQSPYTSIRGVVSHVVGRAAGPLISNIWCSVEKIPEISCPLLIIHGERDALIPCVQGIALYEIAGTPEERKTLQLCKTADHNSWNETRDIFEPIVTFLGNAEFKDDSGLLAEVTVNPELLVVPPEAERHVQSLEAKLRKKHEAGPGLVRSMSAATRSSIAATKSLISSKREQ